MGEKKGFFRRLSEGLSKTRNSIVSGFDSIFTGYFLFPMNRCSKQQHDPVNDTVNRSRKCSVQQDRSGNCKNFGTDAKDQPLCLCQDRTH